jgi:L-cysteine S-thiosulfotransferase
MPAAAAQTGTPAWAVVIVTVFGAALVVLLAAAPARAQSTADAERRAGWRFMTPALQAMQQDLSQHPGQLWVGEGEALWTRPGANGRRCADCHAEVPAVAGRYPRAVAGRPQTLAARIDACRVGRLGEVAEGADGPAVLALQALVAQRSAGRPVEPDPALQDWATRGERLWRTRFGQLNLACAQCHDALAGQRLGGAAIPQAHPTGYPVYRLEWQGVGSLARRLRGCLAGVRAEPFAPGADEWLAIEAWLMRRAAGMPWEGVGLRP